MKLSTEDIESKALTLIREQKSSWEEGVVFVTDRVAFNIRELIKELRRNYWGVFEESIDPTTGRQKIWIPLTESTVESTVKNIDLDTKDINFRAKKQSAVGLTSLVRTAVKEQLDSMYFGEYLDEMERSLCIDGTAVWKIVEDKDEDNKPSFCIYPVDLLNFYIDPSARSIQESDIIERSILTKEEFMQMSGWENKDDVQFSDQIDPNSDMSRTTNKSTMSIEVYEWWGQMPKSFITGNDKDDKEYIPGHIVISNLNQDAVFHLIEKNPNKKGLKPYEEVWYSRVPNRWYGRGPAERLMMLQLYINTVVNIRINRSYVSQLGLWKVRKGSGITAQMLSKLTANGAIAVNNMQDIEQLVMQEASQASYNDENVAVSWAERVTSAFEVVTGETLPASTPATNAVIQSRAAQSSFTFVKEGIGMFLQRVIKRHVMPIIQKRLTPDEVMRLTDEPEKIRIIDERVVNEMVYRKLKEMNKKGEFVVPETVEFERLRALEVLRASSDERMVKLSEKINLSDYDVQVYITNEEIDKGVLIQNLTQMLQMVASIPNSGVDPKMIVRQVFDVAGLDYVEQSQVQPQAGMPQPQQAPQGNIPQVSVPQAGNEQQTFTGANIPA